MQVALIYNFIRRHFNVYREVNKEHAKRTEIGNRGAATDRAC